jgi:hypothetical protein
MYILSGMGKTKRLYGEFRRWEACGEAGSGPKRKRRVKAASAKQEVSFEPA